MITKVLGELDDLGEWKLGFPPTLDYVVYLEPSGKLNPANLLKKFEKILSKREFKRLKKAGFEFTEKNITVIKNKF